MLQIESMIISFGDRNSLLQNTVFSITFSFNVHYVHKHKSYMKKELVKNQNQDL